MSESICADCSSQDPSWASINRGVMICDECCSVHRSLGRHISYVRSLYSTSWPPALREMVSTLVRKGANSIWEHALHDSSSKIKLKKPSPRDKLHPTKHDFIVAKYKHLALLPRTLKDSVTISDDLSKQLHASVRTSNLETCLRLLSLGADPNYLHLDRGNTPIHVAAHAGQGMQVELLLIHGGNPTALDLLGHTPEECARIAGHHQLADRLIECQYELTDKLSLYVSGRKPMHSIGEHFLVPPGASSNHSPSDARNKLLELSNEQFEDLAADVYDEVDRRECDSIWLTTQQLQNSIAFLPVNPMLSATRNQGRQKLATLDSNEFCQLVIDILLNTKTRRNISIETGQRSGTIVPAVGVALPEHDYEDVPVEEDEEMAQSEATPKRRTRPQLTPPVESMYSVVNDETAPPDDNYNRLHTSSPKGGKRNEDTYSYIGIERDRHSDTPPPLKPRPQTTYARLHNKQVTPTVTGGESETVSKVKFNIVMEQLRKIQGDKEELQATNEMLNLKVTELQKQLNKMIEENSSLRHSSTEPTTPTSPPPPLPEVPLTVAISNGQETGDYAEVIKKKKPKPLPSPKGTVKKVASVPPNTLPRVTTPTNTTPTPSPVPKTSNDIPSSPADKITPFEDSPFDEISHTPPPPPPPPHRKSRLSMGTDSVSTPPPITTPPVATPPPTTIPSMDVIQFHIKNTTQCIQTLLKAAQSQRQTEFYTCSQIISESINKLIELFPKKTEPQEVYASIRELERASQHLAKECQSPSNQDLAYHTRTIMNSAYDVAKAARFLVTCVEKL